MTRTITFTEIDELNNPTSTYIYSELEALPSKGEKGHDISISGRVDIAQTSASTPWSIDSLRSLLIDVFLPAGYPHSVSEDYVPYQIFDSLQAFSSSIAGLLASRAVLQGVGVGNADASPTSALLLHILQDTSGRIATILFAHRVGTALEPECKMYRFAADIFNDLAMVLDCLSPMIPAGGCRVAVLSSAGVLRALCGVAGGSSKASLSAHFAKWGNLAEVNAKDSSQETVISLMGMLVGYLVVSHVTGFAATWLTLLVLLALHLSLNYAAVRSVQMTTLNRQRANIVLSTLLSSDRDLPGLVESEQLPEQLLQEEKHDRQGDRQMAVLSPAQVAQHERIFDAGGALRWHTFSPSSTEISELLLGSCQIGVSMHQFLSQSSLTTRSTTSSLKTTIPLGEIADLFRDEEYMIFLAPVNNTSSLGKGGRSRIEATILIQSTTSSTDTDTGSPQQQPKADPHLKAWMHALLTAKLLHTRNAASSGPGTSTAEDILHTLSRTLVYLNNAGRFERYMSALRAKGWDVNTDAEGNGGGRSALQARVGTRVTVSVS
ncbi:vitamin B6 photo-protection and homoeostasis-domain-containing protein [Aspergillus unguis]